MQRLALGIALLLTFPTVVSAATYVVHPDGTGDFPTIQAAVDAAADGDIIELTDGTFSGLGNRGIDYLGKAITIRSQSANPEDCVVDCENADRGFSFLSGEGLSSRLEGVTITNGYGHSYLRHANDGGAVLIEHSDPAIVNCVLTDNRADSDGGGVYCDDASPLIADCVVTHNSAPWDCGGICCVNGSAPSITGCLVGWNSGRDGGGIFLSGNPPVEATVDGCTIVHNTATRYGGGITCKAGSFPSISNCTLYGNSGPYGGGIANWTGGTARLDACIIAATASGAAVYCDETGSSELSCCDVFGNEGGDWIGCIADLLGVNGNICEDPLFCDPDDDDLHLTEDSPCAPFSPPNPECDLIGSLPVGCGPRTFEVLPDGTGDFPTIQAAIDACVDGDTVALADGTFTGEGNRDIDFLGKAIEVRSRSALPEVCIIDCQGTEIDPHRGFYFHSGEGQESVLSGVTIVNGRAAAEHPANCGGGIHCTGASPTISNCVLQANSAEGEGPGHDGGGIYLDSSSAVVTGCVFLANAAADGGGVYCSASAPTLTNCTFSGNAAERGSGIHCWDSAPILENAIIAFGVTGEALYCDGAGNSPSLACCDIYANEGGDWIDCIADQMGINGNISEDPLFCDRQAGDLRLYSTSPCAPFSPPNPECDLIGALPVGCGTQIYEVRPDGTGDYVTIQAAIDAALDQDVIELTDGTFVGEGNRGINYLGKAITIRSRSGDPSTCIIDCQDVDRGFNFRTGEQHTSRLERVTVTNGHGHQYLRHPDDGGAILIENSSPAIVGCVLTGNRADSDGGAIHCDASSPLVEGCVITNNSAIWDCGGVCGINESAPTIEGCLIGWNSGRDGGGIFLNPDGASSAAIEGCTITHNSATRLGGGVLCHGSSPSIRNTTFYGNAAPAGGGALASRTTACPQLDACILAASTSGGAVYCDEIGTAVLSCCDVFGNEGGDWVGCIEDQLGIFGNFSADPLFCDAAGSDFTLEWASPCALENSPECGQIGAWPVGCGYWINAEGTGAFATIQDAVDAVPDGARIWLASGVYRGTGNRDVELGSKNLILVSQGGNPDSCVIDCEGTVGDPHRGFLLAGGQSEDTQIVGVTIANGYAPESDPRGGAIKIDGAAPLLSNCVFTRGTAEYGGAVCADDLSFAAFDGCTFTGNSADYGGALCCDFSSLSFSGCTFAQNSGTGEPTSAGGIEVFNYGSALLERCIIAFSPDGQAVQCRGSSSASLVCCDLYGNEAGDWVGPIHDQHGEEGNFSLDPCFCDMESDDYHLWNYSPCNQEGCGLIGAWPVGCWEPQGADDHLEAAGVAQILLSAAPNPFNGMTRIVYGVRAAAMDVPAHLGIFDATGRLVRTLASSPRHGGVRAASWDGHDQWRNPVGSGMYYVRLQAGEQEETTRLMLIR